MIFVFFINSKDSLSQNTINSETTKIVKMDFKYFDDYVNLTSLTKDKIECQICKTITICFDSASYGSEKMEHVCPNCIFDKKLYDKDISLNEGDISWLVLQLKEINKDLNENQIQENANKKTIELEKGTPHLLTWQDFEWPCLDGDYAKFIGFGSKPLFNSLALDAKGKKLFKKSIHPELMDDFEEDFWDEMPNKLITNLKETNGLGILTYVFKSLTSEKIIVWIDQE
jgi:uncharacterized protein CbrC (UPF0167 family)